jgi:4-oxalocrotonate tautomerase
LTAAAVWSPISVPGRKPTPPITIDVLENVCTPRPKRDLVESDTEAAISVEGESLRTVIQVRVQEFEQGDWAIGGKALKASDVQALAAGKAA